MSSKIVLLPLVLIAAIILMGDNQAPPVAILWPAGPDSVSYDQAKLMIVSAVKGTTPDFVVSSQWSITKYFDLTAKPDKENFPKEFYKLFAPNTTLQQMAYTFTVFNGFMKAETLNVAYTDTLSIRGLWKRAEFAALAKGAQEGEVLGVILSLRGWRDSLYTPVYDDPNDANRAYYKLHLQLVPGENTVYVGLAGARAQAVPYFTNFTTGYVPTTEMKARFHNSALEQSCVTCHEGLPSADGGATMKADCNVCHKTFAGAIYQHSPVEMKECSDCHSWSVEKKAVVVEQGVPATCYTCHDAKKAEVENSPTMHPVAGDCLTCHSQHGTDRKHLLKTDVYSLCTSCHEDQKLNHPVGRHPLRFKTVASTGEEISCVSCHNPHGTTRPKLLRSGNSPMEVCTQCH